MSFRTSIDIDFFLAGTAEPFSVVFFDASSELGFLGILPTFSSDFGWILAKVSLSFSAWDFVDSNFLSFVLLELELEDFEVDLCLSLSRLLDEDDPLLWPVDELLL